MITMKKERDLDLDTNSSLKFLNHDQVEDTLLTMFDSLTTETVTPDPAFCIRTRISTTHQNDSSSLEQDANVFINLCTSNVIPPPPRISNDTLKAILSYRGDDDDETDSLATSAMLSYKIPVSLSEAKFDHHHATIYDVCMHPDILPLCEAFEDYKLLVTELAIEWVEDRYLLSLDRDFEWIPDLTHMGILSKIVPSLISSYKPKISELPSRISPPSHRLSSSSSAFSSPPYQISEEPHRIVIRLTFPKTIMTLAATSRLEVEEHEIEFKNDLHHYYLKLDFPEKRICPEKVDAVYYSKSHHLYFYLPLV